MANSLLDFVISLVRDPEAAARYAADPAQAIADAHLTDVTSTDVSNLIPMVSESLSMSAPVTGTGILDEHSGGNVWASGAATAAFDAFDDHLPDHAFDNVHTLAGNVIDQASVANPDLATVADTAVNAFDPGVDDASLQLDHPLIDELPHTDTLPADVVDHAVSDIQHIDDGAHGFDIFS